MARQTNEPASDGDLLSDLGDEIRVTVDRWSVGQLGLPDIVLAVVVVAIGAALAWVAQRVANRYAGRVTGVARGAIHTVGQLAGVACMLLAMAIALEMLGFSLGPVLVLVLVAVVALLILRPMITNLSTGLLLQLRGAFNLGDLVRTNDVIGVVEQINARTVVLHTTDGRRLHIPNSDVLNAVIENYTAMGRRRSSVKLTVSSEADVGMVSRCVQEALGEVHHILDDPPAEVVVSHIEGQYVVMEVLFWHRPEAWAQRRATDRVARSALRALSDAGIALVGPAWPVATAPIGTRP